MNAKEVLHQFATKAFVHNEMTSFSKDLKTKIFLLGLTQIIAILIGVLAILNLCHSYF